jgi:surfeit locus 1 family protein
MPNTQAFRLRPVPLLATLLVAAAGIMLGNWQTRRGDMKEALQARLDARAKAAPLVLGATSMVPTLDEAEFRRVRVHGHYLAQWPVYLDNRPHDGQPGFVVLMPLELADTSRVVWVARGWAPRDMRDRAKLPVYPTPSGDVTVEGIAVARMGSFLQIGQPQPVRSGGIAQNVTLAQLEQAQGSHTLPFFIQQHGAAGDTLVRDWPAPSLGVEKHRGYALQWYGLAATAIVFYIVTGFRRRKQGNPQDDAS